MIQHYSTKRRHYFYLILCITILFNSSFLQGQDIGLIANNLSKLKEQKFNITGGIQFSNQSYWASGINPRRDAFQWGVRANLSLAFLGITAPFSLAFSDANTNYNLPSYTFVGVSPRYKWATLHAGDRSMNFSKYTMSGISFRGVGLSLEPGKFHASGFYGRLNRALAHDYNTVGNINGLYDRQGYGFRVGYGGQKSSYHINFFSASDDDQSFPTTQLGDVLQPSNNQVASIELRQQLGNRFALAGEWAHSVYNQNQNANILPDDQQTMGNSMLGLFTPTESISNGDAYNVGLFYNYKNLGLRTTYERIGRGFRTLGALFFNKDTENITLGANRNFLDNKLSIFLNGGLERTDLDKIDGEANKRIIASINFSYRPQEEWLFSGGYSNFRNDTKIRARTDILQPVDSLFLAQVNQSINLVAMRRLGSEEKPSSLQLILNHQRANSIVMDEIQTDADTRFTTAALNYSAGNPEGGWQWTTGLTVNSTQLGTVNRQSIAPVLSLNRNFFDNSLATYIRTALSLYQQKNQSNDMVFNLALGSTYRLKNSHRLSLSFTHVNRFGSDEALRNFYEWYGQLSYGYRFGGRL